MKKSTMGRRGLWLLCASMALVAGCGGGGDAGDGSDGGSSTPPAPPPPPPTVSVLAGQIGGPGVADGSGSAGRLSWAGGLASDGQGTAYLTDPSNATVRRIGADGAMTTLAGVAGQSEERDGAGSAARFTFPTGMARDAAGNLYVVDGTRIRKIAPDGTVSTLAGNGQSTTHDGTGTNASFYVSSGAKLTIDSAGNLYLAESAAVRKITPQGVVTTLAGVPDGGTPTQVGPLFGVGDIAMGPDGNLYAVNGSVIDRIAPDGTISTFSGNGNPIGLPVLQPTDGPAASAVYLPWDRLAFGADGMLRVFEADQGVVRMRQVDADGAASTVVSAVDGLSSADTVAADGGGFDLGSGSRVVHVDASGQVTPLVGQAANAGTADGQGTDARFWSPGMAATDASGNAYVVDRGGYVVRKIAVDGTVTTVFDNTAMTSLGGEPIGYLAVDGPGAVYLSRVPVLFVYTSTVYRIESGKATAWATPNQWTGLKGDLTARPAFYAMAGLPDGGVALCTSLGLLRVNAQAAVVSQNQQVDGCSQIAVTPSGGIYLLQNGDVGTAVYNATGSGQPVLLAGKFAAMGFVDGTGGAARFGNATSSGPVELTADAQGNLYLLDGGNRAVRKITPHGVVSTVIGGPTVARQVVPGTPGALNAPAGIAVRSVGGVEQLLVSDQSEDAVVVAPLP